MASPRKSFLTVAVISVLLLGNCVEANILEDIACAAVVGVGVFVAAPVVLGAAGFTAAGITASSLGASMMSASAVSSGGVVATLQSAGVLGLSAKTAALVGTGAAAIKRAAKNNE